MDAREEFPRISVGSVQDWKKLQTSYRNAAITRLEEHILAKGLDNERDVLIAYTNEFIDRTFRIAQPNLRVNGQNFEFLNQSEQNIVPFDEALDRRIWSLAATRLQWQKRIAETRRKLPVEIETQVFDLLEEQRAADMEETTSAMAETVLEEDMDKLSRFLQIAEGFQQALALGEELDQMIPTQEERAGRVRDVAVEVERA